ACLLTMRLPPFVRRPMPSSAWEGVRQAVAFIQGDARVWALVALVAVFSVLGFPFIVLMPVIARDVLHTDARGYGLLMAAVGIGAMLGAVGSGDGVLRLRVRGDGAAGRLPGGPHRGAHGRAHRDRLGRSGMSHRRGVGRVAGARATPYGVAEVGEVGGGWRRLIRVRPP